MNILYLIGKHEFGEILYYFLAVTLDYLLIIFILFTLKYTAFANLGYLYWQKCKLFNICL